ncbi:MAG: bifunctional precorrin-2 dehydrogenase/sirohydrochlorin ferrochelatase [Litorilinea sp.]
MEQAQTVYPIFLTNLDRIVCVVVGGGTIATRKVRGLLAAQATVRVISPQLTIELAERHAAGHIAWHNRPWQAGDLEDAGLAVAATDVRAVNRAVAHEAQQRGILCNVVDAPHEGSFHVPAVYRGVEDDAPVVVAIGTGGTEPRRAVRLRDRIAAWLAAPR